MEWEFVIIYRQDFGAKYSCIDLIAADAEEARRYALNAYSYLITENNIVKVVKLGRVKTNREVQKEESRCLL